MNVCINQNPEPANFAVCVGFRLRQSIRESMQVEEAMERRIEALRAAGMPVPRRKVLHQQVVHVSVDGRKVSARRSHAIHILQHSVRTHTDVAVK